MRRSDVRFLSTRQVLELHDEALRVGPGSDGIRDYGLIDSAVTALLIAALANAVFKSVLLGWSGGKIAVWGIAAIAAMCVAGGIAWLIPSPLGVIVQPSG